jgi:hypothetical protein
LGIAAQEVKGVGADERDGFAKFDEGFEFLFFLGCQDAVVVTIHEGAEAAVGRRGQVEGGDGFDHFSWG